MAAPEKPSGAPMPLVSFIGLAMSGSPLALAEAKRADFNANLAYPNGDKYSPLHAAAHGGNLELVTHLLVIGAKTDALTAHKQTALILAAHAGHENVVKILVDAGADLSIKDENGATAFMHAKSRAKKSAVHRTIAALLQRAGEAHKMKEAKSPKEAGPCQGATCTDGTAGGDCTVC